MSGGAAVGAVDPAPRPRSRAVPLEALATAIGAGRPPAGILVSGVALDSRSVRAGDLYAALPGRTVHGAGFASAAVAAGAVAILTDSAGAPHCAGLPVPVLVVPEPRALLGGLSARVYGSPATELLMIGVTGTNGKTTTAAMVEAGLRAAGRTTGLIGTTGVLIGDDWFAGSRTTPEAPDLQALLRTMRDRRCTAAVMEVSSIAVAERRVDGLAFDVTAFTNLSQDHLDYHGSMRAYFEAKALLFRADRTGRAVVGVDDEWGAELAVSAAAEVPVVTWSLTRAADWTIAGRAGTDWLVRGPQAVEQVLASPLPGEHNLANALCALAVLHEAGIEDDIAVAGIASAAVPGRMQAIRVGDITGIVDYAHSPDAIERALVAVRGGSAGRVLAVLGAGGDRDRGKREPMGAVAASLADTVVITDDNPRSEDAAVIRAALRVGAVSRGTDADIREEPDRAAAIRLAVELARSGDVVVVLGKGHEQGQEVAGIITPFDDATVLRDCLARRAEQ